MKELQGTKTEENLIEAFKLESISLVKYKLFADESDYKEVEKFFNYVARQEEEHAEVFLELLNGLGNDLENLRNSVALEGFVSSIDYPEAAEVAYEEGFPEIAEKFKEIATIEERHKKSFENYLNLIKHDMLLKSSMRQKWMCMKCGFIYEDYEPPKECPVCGHKRKDFKLYEEGE